jgi:hypothetical protein
MLPWSQGTAHFHVQLQNKRINVPTKTRI